MPDPDLVELEAKITAYLEKKGLPKTPAIYGLFLRNGVPSDEPPPKD